jgi:tetratricopeptide (TPR) repeat protein
MELKFDFTTVICFILIFGAFGGISSYIAFCIYGTDGGFRDKFHIDGARGISFAFLSGVLGIAGAVAIQVFVIGMRFYEKQNAVLSDFVYLAAICLIGGFAARTFLGQATQMFASQIKKQLDEQKEIVERVEEVETKRFVLIASLNQNSTPDILEDVVIAADKGLKNNADDPIFIIAKGAALKRLGRISQAIETLTPYIAARSSASQPDKYISTAYYNRACYHALQQNFEAARADFKRALELSENVARDKEYAKADPDFGSLKDDPTFTAMLN